MQLQARRAAAIDGHGKAGVFHPTKVAHRGFPSPTLMRVFFLLIYKFPLCMEQSAWAQIGSVSDVNQRTYYYIIILIIQGKQNQYSKVKHIGYIYNTNPILYPLFIIAFYFFNYQGKNCAKSFLLFQQLKNYYNLYIFPSSIKVP